MYKWYHSHMRKVRVEDLAGSYEMRCNEVQPCDGIKSVLDGTPTTEKVASLLVATLRGASDWPWREIMAQGFGMRATLRGASNQPWCVKSRCKDLRWDY